MWYQNSWQQTQNKSQSTVYYIYLSQIQTTTRTRTHFEANPRKKLSFLAERSNIFHMSSSADFYNIPSSPSQSPRPGQKKGRRKREREKVFWYQKKGAKGIVGLIFLVGLFFIFNGFMVLRLQLDDEISGNKDVSVRNSSSISVSIKVYFSLKLSCG